jgi:ATP-binding cassette subfamily B protein
LGFFATLIPIIMFFSNLAILIILVLWGHFVILGTISLWDFVAFNAYLSILIFPIIIIWFMSTVIAQASASYGRILDVLDSKEEVDEWNVVKKLDWSISMKNIGLNFGDKCALRNINFSIKPNTRTAIIWPTAAWKTQLLNILTGLIKPSTWLVKYDSNTINEYNKNLFMNKLV